MALCEGDRVVLRKGFESVPHAYEGPLRPGDVGELLEDDGTSMPYLVKAHGITWWYASEALCRMGDSEAAGGSDDRLCVGERVVLRKGFESVLDASDGPLRPGDIGEVVAEDNSRWPYQVKALDGQTWWYAPEALRRVGDFEETNTKREFDRLKYTIEEQTTKLHEAESEIADLKSALHETRKDVTKKSLEIVALTKQSSDLSSQVETLIERISGMSAELEALTRRISECPTHGNV